MSNIFLKHGKFQENAFSMVSAIVGLGVASIIVMFVSQMLSQSMKGQKSTEIRADRLAIARHILARVDCSKSFLPTTCDTAGPKILRDKDNVVLIKNASPETKFGSFSIKVECSADGKYLLARAAILAPGGTLTSTSDSHFIADPLSKKVVNWTNVLSLLYPEDVGVCADTGERPSVSVLSSESVYRNSSAAATVTVPLGTQRVQFNSVSHQDTGYTPPATSPWVEEDTVVAAGYIDLKALNWTGYRALTVGRSDNTNLSIIWNNAAFGAMVPLAGDLNTDAAHATYLSSRPMVSYNSGTRVLTLSNINPSPTSETVTLFTYYK
ncbi:MAG: hypothetical protein NT027_06650 [Proteobacteria bacterium]|nr:hypothetical protein [Pseudomonadota bacterium]